MPECRKCGKSFHEETLLGLHERYCMKTITSPGEAAVNTARNLRSMLVDLLFDEEHSIREAAAELLAENLPENERLSTAHMFLRNDSAAVKCAGVRLLPYPLELESRRFLTPLMKSEDRELAFMAGARLFEEGHEEAERRLVTLLTEGSLPSRLRLLELAESISPAGFEKILAKFEEEPDPKFLARACELAGTLHAIELTPLLKKLLTHEENIVTDAAAFALAKVGNMAGAGHIREKLKEEDDERRARLLSYIGRLGDSKLLPTVEQFLRSRGVYTRKEAVLALGAFEGKRVLSLLETALSDESVLVRSAALVSIYRLAPHTRARFIENDFSLKEKESRIAILECIGRVFSDETHFAVILSAYGDLRREVRLKSVEAAARMGGEKTADFLMDALADPSRPVILEAFKSLVRRGKISDKLIEKVRNYLRRSS